MKVLFTTSRGVSSSWPVTPALLCPCCGTVIFSSRTPGTSVPLCLCCALSTPPRLRHRHLLFHATVPTRLFVHVAAPVPPRPGKQHLSIDTKTHPGELCLSLLVPWWTRYTLFHALVRVPLDLSVGWSDGSVFLARKPSDLFFQSSDFLRSYRNSSSFSI